MKKSFFPHAGNKSNIVEQILELVPEKYNVYYEPFLGSGIVFINLFPKKAVLNDIDFYVYNAWKAIEEDPEPVYDMCINTQQEYNALCFMPHIKDSIINNLCGTLDSIQPNMVLEAAYWINLKKISFNSTVYHEKGIISKPTGKKKISLSKYRDMLYIYNLLKNSDVDIHCEDYLKILKEVKKGDFVYLDPPYLDSNLQYTQNENNRELFSGIINEIDRLTKLGTYVLLSMEENEKVLEAFKDYNITKIKVWRYMSRRYTNELLIKNY